MRKALACAGSKYNRNNFTCGPGPVVSVLRHAHQRIFKLQMVTSRELPLRGGAGGCVSIWLLQPDIYGRAGCAPITHRFVAHERLDGLEIIRCRAAQIFIRNRAAITR